MIEEALIGPLHYHDKYGYLNQAGAFAIPPEFEELGDVSEGLVSCRIGEYIGFLDETGSLVIPARFKALETMPVFRRGLAAVRENGLTGYISKSADWRIQPKWDRGWNFHGSYALVQSSAGYFVINDAGHIATKLDVWDVPWFPDWVSDWNCFRCLFAADQGFMEGCLNLRGEVVFPPIHKRLTDFYAGVAGYCDEDDALGARWGLLDFKGGILKNAQYLGLDSFSEELAAAAQDISKTGWPVAFGYIDTTGAWVIPPRFTEAFRFQGGLARVALGGTRAESGEWVQTPLYGFINKVGEFVIDAKFAAATDFRSGHAIVKLRGNSVVINRQGCVIWDSHKN